MVSNMVRPYKDTPPKYLDMEMESTQDLLLLLLLLFTRVYQSQKKKI